MKKRMMALVSMALAGAMVLPMAAMAGETEAAAAAADEGKVLNIEVWNEEGVQEQDHGSLSGL